MLASPVPLNQRPEALWLLLADLDEEVRKHQIASLIQAAANEPAVFDGLLAVVDQDGLCGVVWAQVLRGKTGVLWPPRIIEQANDDVAGRLLLAARDFWVERDIAFVQAVLPRQLHSEDADTLRSHGFRLLTELDYFACSLQLDDADWRSDDAELAVAPYAESDHNELIQIVDRTYSGTLDCPEMNGVRTTAEVLDGYAGTGVSGTAFWYLARWDGRGVGCLLLADHRNGDFELVYVGLIPEARGRAWGSRLTRFAKRVAAENGGTRILLAVDRRNAPAREIYRRLSFTPWDQRSVWIWTNH